MHGGRQPRKTRRFIYGPVNRLTFHARCVVHCVSGTSPRLRRPLRCNAQTCTWIQCDAPRVNTDQAPRVSFSTVLLPPAPQVHHNSFVCSGLEVNNCVPSSVSPLQCSIYETFQPEAPSRLLARNLLKSTIGHEGRRDFLRH